GRHGYGVIRSVGIVLTGSAWPESPEHPSQASSVLNTNQNGKHPQAYQLGVARCHAKWHTAPDQAEAHSPPFALISFMTSISSSRSTISLRSRAFSASSTFRCFTS